MFRAVACIVGREGAGHQASGHAGVAQVLAAASSSRLEPRAWRGWWPVPALLHTVHHPAATGWCERAGSCGTG